MLRSKVEKANKDPPIDRAHESFRAGAEQKQKRTFLAYAGFCRRRFAPYRDESPSKLDIVPIGSLGTIYPFT